jgi:tetratricopeptide (TPR) repeat protein
MTIIFILSAVSIMLLTACSKPVPIEVQIQEQLDLGNKYLTEMNYEQAVIAFTKAIELDAKNIAAYEGLGSVYMAQENYEDAGAAYRTVIDLDNSNIAAYRNLVQVYDATNDYEQGIDIYNKLIELDGGSWSAYEGAARAYEALGRRDEAIAVAERGLKAADVSEEGKSYVIGLYRQVIVEAENDGDYAKAIEYCSRILEIDPQDREAGAKLEELNAAVEEQERAEEARAELAPYEADIREMMEGILAEEDIDYAASVLLREDFQELLKKIEEKTVIALDNGKYIGLYPEGYLYYGDMNKEQIREGQGIWILEADDYSYYYSGEWKDDYPNGEGYKREQYHGSDPNHLSYTTTTTFKDGYYNVTVTSIFSGYSGPDRDRTFVYNCTMGIPEIIEGDDTIAYAVEDVNSSLGWGERPLGVMGACRE